MSRQVIVRGIQLTFATIAVLALTACPPPNGSNGNGDTPGEIPTGLAPGLIIHVIGVFIPGDLRPEVIFQIRDQRGNLLAVTELADARFILTYLEDPPMGSTARHVSYTTTIERDPASGAEATQVTYDAARLNGITPNGDGSYTYKFTTALPPDFSRAATHQLGGQFRRNFAGDGRSYVYNLSHVFRPDGGTATARRDIVSTESCNACHTRLSEHGDIRREVQLCIQCHNHQSIDANTGNSVEFAEMIHKIHRGVDLPSVQDGEPYQLIGFGGTVFDYSTVHFPQEVNNCVACHQGAPQADVYKTTPTFEGCVSCHDRTWFGNPDLRPDGFTNHVGGMQANNSLCSLCHTPDRPGSSPIVPAHVIPTQSDLAPGLFLEITEVRAMLSAKQAGSATLTIDFTATNATGEGIADPAVLDGVAATVAYPVPEYETWNREVIIMGGMPRPALVNNGGGAYSYTFTAPLPMLDTTFAVAMEGRRRFDFRDMSILQGTETNGQVLFTLNGAEPAMRRDIVSEEQCNECHREIRFHGAQRVGVNYCLMCHTPNQTDIARRPMDSLPPESVHFKTMIHAIHMGEELERDFTVFGFGGVPHDYTHVRYPAPRQACDACHLPGTIDLPLPSEALPTIIRDAQQAVVSERLPERASCNSCHDGVLPNIHALLATDPQTRVESCAVCHGPNTQFAVQAIHALNP